MTTTVRVNGAEKPFTASTVSDLLKDEGVDPAAPFLAVAVNAAVVPRTDWAAAVIRPGDEIEIVKPFSGG